MEEGISRVLSESRIIADFTDFADFKLRKNPSFVIRGSAFFFVRYYSLII